MSEQNRFELEPEPTEKRTQEPATAPGTPALPHAPAPRGEDAKRTRARAHRDRDAQTRQERRFRRRLLRLVPGFVVAFLIVAWAFVGGGYWAYALAGAAVGVFAAYRRTNETILGSISVAVGFGTTLALVGFVPSIMTFYVVVSFGAIGTIAGLDDRLRGS